MGNVELRNGRKSQPVRLQQGRLHAQSHFSLSASSQHILFVFSVYFVVKKRIGESVQTSRLL